MPQPLPAGHLYGTTVRRAQIGGVLMSETRYAAGLSVPRHSHEEAGFCFVLRGVFDRQFTTGERDCTPGTLSFHPAGEAHAETFRRAGATLFSVQLATAWLDRFSDGGAALDDSLTTREGEIARLTRQLHREFRAPDDLSALSVEGVLLELAAEIARQRPDTTQPRWLLRVRDLLHDRFREPITLSDVAAAVGIHPSHVARTFRQHYRCSVGEYVRRLRVGYVRSRLAESDEPLVDLALAAGFANQAHMSTVFRRLEQTTPSDYRRQYRARA